MKKLGFLFAFVLLLSSAAFANDCKNCCTDCAMDLGLKAKIYKIADEETSIMVLECKAIVGKEKKAEALKKHLMGVQGIKDVSVCTTSGTVKVSYVKAELGCCSKIHQSMTDGGYKFTVVSNDEKPACQKVCPGKTAAPSKAQ